MTSQSGTTQMPDWLANLIRSVARAVTTFITVAWTWDSFRKKASDVSDQAKKVRDDALRAFGREPEPSTWSERVRGGISSSRPVRALRQANLLPEETMKENRGWSFFKVILVLGIVIAVAVFILDRVLPKPYRDDELDEAWDEDETFGEGLDLNQPPADEDAIASDNGAKTKKAKKTEGVDDPSEE